MINIEAEIVAKVYHSNKKEITEIPKGVAVLKSRTIWEYVFGETLTEEERTKVWALAQELADRKYFDASIIPFLAHHLKKAQDKIVALNQKSDSSDSDILDTAGLYLHLNFETSIGILGRLQSEFKSKAYLEAKKSFEDAVKDYEKLVLDTGHSRAVRSAYYSLEFLLFLTTAVSVFYINLGLIVLGTIAGVLLALDFMTPKPQANLEIDQAMPEKELRSKFASFGFFEPKSDDITLDEANKEDDFDLLNVA